MTHTVRKQTWYILAILIAGAVDTTTALAQKPGSKTIPVISTIEAVDPAVASELQIQHDLLGPEYSTTSTGLNSWIVISGDWRLDGYYQADTMATRTIFLKFDRPVGTTVLPGTPTSALYKVNFGSNCSNLGTRMQDIPLGQFVWCPMNVHFDGVAVGETQTRTFNLRMNSANDTDYVKVTCIEYSGGCTKWQIRPGQFQDTDPSPEGVRMEWASRANLSYETKLKNKVVDAPVGNFYFSFSIDFRRP